MARIDNQFLTKILREPRCDWMSLGITSSMMSLDTRPIFVFIKQEATKFGGRVPNVDTVKQFYPNFRLRKCPEPVEFYAERIIRRNTEARLRELAASLSELLVSEEPDIDEAIQSVTDLNGELSASSSRMTDIDFGKNPAQRLRELRALERGHVADFSLGHKILDEDLIGAEKGNFFIIAGTPASGKSWLLLKTLLNLWELEGLDILLFSYELSERLIRRRLDSLTAQVNYKKFRHGLLTHEEHRAFALKTLRDSKRGNFFKILTNENCDPMSKTGPGRMDYVYSKILHYKPQIVGIDGFYLMTGQGDSDWERIASLTRGFHNVTQATGVCGWATTQLTKTSDEKNPKLRDLSYSWTFAQDTDGAFLLSKPSDMRDAHEISMTVGKFREAEDNMRYVIDFDPGARVEVERLELPIENPLME